MDAPARVTPAARRDIGVEAIDVRTTDGWSLRAHVYEPPASAHGVAVLAHALGADKGSFDRPGGAGLGPFLARSGWCVVTFDFRGHGESHPVGAAAGECSYDRLLDHDLAAVCDFARWRAQSGLPVVGVGHGLGGHAVLAAAGVAAVVVDAIVAFASAPWIPALDPSRARGWARRAIAEGAGLAGRAWSRLPERARAAFDRNGPRAVAADVVRFARTGHWRSADGCRDYLASLAAVRVPVLHIVSDGDAFACPPECAERLAARTGGRREVFRVSRGDGGTRPPGPMGLVTSGRAERTWSRVEAWMRAASPAVARPKDAGTVAR